MTKVKVRDPISKSIRKERRKLELAKKKQQSEELGIEFEDYSSKPDNKPSQWNNKRDFCSDLDEYLSLWSNKDDENVNWKFNKTLQTWSLAHCLDIDEMDSDLFDKLCPYIKSIQGSAADRFRTKCCEIIENPEDFNADEHSVKLKRAKIIVKILK